jgi:hypothetical protein
MRKFFVLLSLCLGLPAAVTLPAQADPRHLLAVSGDWKLYRDESYDIGWKNGKHILLSNVCVAETVQVQTTMDVVALPANTAQPDTSLNGQLLLRVSTGQWNYAGDWNHLYVTVMNHEHMVRKAFYYGPWITAPMGDLASSSNPFARAAAIWGETISFANRQKEALTSVRAGGLNAVYAQLLTCARS